MLIVLNQYDVLWYVSCSTESKFSIKVSKLILSKPENNVGT